jgi:hypothetical protein
MCAPHLGIMSCAMGEPYRKHVFPDPWMLERLTTAIQPNHPIKFHPNRDNPLCPAKVWHVLWKVNGTTEQNQRAYI